MMGSDDARCRLPLHRGARAAARRAESLLRLPALMAGQGALATGAAASERVVVLRGVLESEEARHRPLRYPHRRFPTGTQETGRAGVGAGAAAQPGGGEEGGRPGRERGWQYGSNTVVAVPT